MRAAEADTPLSGAEIEALFAPIASVEVVALAVSGGADSLALLAAADRWQKSGHRTRLIVLTVDHGLRPGSRIDAERAAETARGLGHLAHVLVWEGDKPGSDIEAAARAARYRLLAAAAREAHASHLLLAHSRDDQAETFLMRLERGSGLFGLAAMRREIALEGVTIHRPFLEIPRTRLAATTAAAGLAVIDDPMNRDRRFLRVRIRRLMPALAAAGIEAADLAGIASRIARAADALDAWTGRVIAEAVNVDACAVATLDRNAFLSAPEEVRLRLLARLLMAIGGAPYPPRFERLKSLHNTLTAGHQGRRTLAGVVVAPRRHRILFYRETGRGGLPEMTVGPGFTGSWDHRFRIALAADAPPNLILSALGDAGRRAVGAGADAVPAAALATLPALRAGGGIVAVPALDWRVEGALPFGVSAKEIVSRRLAEPLRFPDLAES